jgi:hypothetical protein
MRKNILKALSLKTNFAPPSKISIAASAFINYGMPGGWRLAALGLALTLNSSFTGIFPSIKS